MQRQRSGRARTAVAALAVLLLAGASLIAAHVPDRPPVTVTRARLRATAVVDQGGAAGHGVPGIWLVYVGVLVALVLLLLALVLRDGIRLRTEPPEAEQATAGDAPVRATDGLVREQEQALVAAGQALAAGGVPRDVVIACWVRLEQAAEAAGRGRRPAETGTDVARRWLAHGADAHAVDVLAGLFHEARYSTHPMTGSHRATALDALRRLTATAAR